MAVAWPTFLSNVMRVLTVCLLSKRWKLKEIALHCILPNGLIWRQISICAKHKYTHGHILRMNFSLSNWFTRQYSFRFHVTLCVPYGIIIAWRGAIFNFALRRKQTTINNHQVSVCIASEKRKKRTTQHHQQWVKFFAKQPADVVQYQNYDHVA